MLVRRGYQEPCQRCESEGGEDVAGGVLPITVHEKRRNRGAEATSRRLRNVVTYGDAGEARLRRKCLDEPSHHGRSPKRQGEAHGTLGEECGNWVVQPNDINHKRAKDPHTYGTDGHYPPPPVPVRNNPTQWEDETYTEGQRRAVDQESVGERRDLEVTHKDAEPDKREIKARRPEHGHECSREERPAVCPPEGRLDGIGRGVNAVRASMILVAVVLQVETGDADQYTRQKGDPRCGRSSYS